MTRDCKSRLIEQTLNMVTAGFGAIVRTYHYSAAMVHSSVPLDVCFLVNTVCSQLGTSCVSTALSCACCIRGSHTLGWVVSSSLSQSICVSIILTTLNRIIKAPPMGEEQCSHKLFKALWWGVVGCTIDDVSISQKQAGKPSGVCACACPRRRCAALRCVCVCVCVRVRVRVKRDVHSTSACVWVSACAQRGAQRVCAALYSDTCLGTCQAPCPEASCGRWTPRCCALSARLMARARVRASVRATATAVSRPRKSSWRQRTRSNCNAPEHHHHTPQAQCAVNGQCFRCLPSFLRAAALTNAVPAWMLGRVLPTSYKLLVLSLSHRVIALILQLPA